MNRTLKASIRRSAIAEGRNPSSWSNADFATYALDTPAIANDLSPDDRDTLAALVVADIEPAGEPAKASVPNAAPAPTPTPAPSAPPASPLDALAALQSLIASTLPAGVSEERVRELIAEGGTGVQRIDVTVNQPSRKPVTIEGCHRQFPQIMGAIAAGVNVCAVGPAGSGKSTIFEQAAKALGIDYYFQGAAQQEHKVLGIMDAHGVYHPTQFREAYEKGGLFVFEEFDGSHPRALLAINNAVAGNWCDFPDGKVAKHPDFVCVMAGNTYGTGASREYVGRSQLDAATLDRFVFIHVDYDEALELAICESIWEKASSWVRHVQKFRAAAKAANVKAVISPRASIMGTRLLMSGMDIEDVKAMALHKGLTADQLALIGGAF